MAISSTLCCWHNAAKLRTDLSHIFCGACGNIVVLASNFPVSSITVTFTPVRRPGSSASVVRIPAGAAISKSFKLRAKTLIASSSAFSRSSPSKSFSRLRCSFTFQVHCTAVRKNASAAWPSSFILKWLAIICSHRLCAVSSLASGTSCNCNTPSLRPRNIASARCDGVVFQLSVWAK